MIYTWITLKLNNQNCISYSSVISAAFALIEVKSIHQITFKFNQMYIFMNSFAALNREEIVVEDLSRTLIKRTRFTSPLALSLYRCSTVISIGCPGIIWSLKTSGLLCQRTTAHDLCSQGKTFFYLTFFTVSYDLKKILTYFFFPRVELSRVEKFRLAGIRTLTSAILVQCSNQYVLGTLRSVDGGCLRRQAEVWNACLPTSGSRCA